MALLGRIACPLGDNPSAHVKQNEGKRPFLHCPECGFLGHAKNGTQERLMLAAMRPEAGTVPAPPVAADPIIVPKGTAEAATPAATPAAPVKRASFWSGLGGS